jgi:tetratricopeptide (TPR) repeat protein
LQRMIRNLEAVGRSEEALEVYDRLLVLTPNMADHILNDKGVTLNNLGRYNEAIQAFDAALETHPDQPSILGNKGVALYELGRHEEAIDFLCRSWLQREQLSDRGAVVGELLRYLGKEPEEC